MTAPSAAGRQPQQPEDLQRPRRVAEQELDRHAGRGRRGSVRDSPYLDVPARARAMVDHHLGDAHALLAGDRRQEPVHLAVEAQRLDDLRAEHLERAAVVVQRDARGHGDQPVGEHRRHAAGEERVLAVLAPAADDVEAARRSSSHHPRDVGGVVLQVAVGGDHQPAARVARSRPRTRPSGRSCGGSG